MARTFPEDPRDGFLNQSFIRFEDRDALPPLREEEAFEKNFHPSPEETAGSSSSGAATAPPPSDPGSTLESESEYSSNLSADTQATSAPSLDGPAVKPHNHCHHYSQHERDRAILDRMQIDLDGARLAVEQLRQ
jgi:hypothetical protein